MAIVTCAEIVAVVVQSTRRQLTRPLPPLNPAKLDPLGWFPLVHLCAWDGGGQAAMAVKLAQSAASKAPPLQ